MNHIQSPVPKPPPGSWQIMFNDSESQSLDQSVLTELKSMLDSGSVEVTNVIIPESSLTQSISITPVAEVDLDTTEDSLTSSVTTEEDVAGSRVNEEEETEVGQSEVVTAKEKATPTFKHHTGPFKIRYIDESKARCKTFTKRKATLMKNADELHILTGAKVILKIETAAGNCFYYNSEPEKESSCVEVQTDPVENIEPLVTLIKRKTAADSDGTFHTPKKVCQVPSHPILAVENLPGKKKNPKESYVQETNKTSANLEKSSASTAVNKSTVKCVTKKSSNCKDCGIEHESEEDAKFRKGQMRKTTWIGCDRPRCQYWAHASCAGVTLKPGIPVKKHHFLCLQHRKR